LQFFCKGPRWLQFFCKGADGGCSFFVKALMAAAVPFFLLSISYNTLDELYFVVLGSFGILCNLITSMLLCSSILWNIK
jgi:hypothetical protein